VVSALGGSERQSRSSHETVGIGVSVDHGAGRAVDALTQLGDAATAGGGAAVNLQASNDARAPPLDGPNVAVTGGVTSMQGKDSYACNG
jgi:hypothetical protein